MSDLLATVEISSPEEVIENAKETMQNYANFDPNPKLYHNLTAQERLRFCQGTFDQRETVDLLENHNPYNPEKFTKLIETAKLMLKNQGGDEDLIKALDYLLDNFQKSKPDKTGRQVSQQQVEALQNLLRQTLGSIG